MNLITWHGKPSKECPPWADMEQLAKDLKDFADNGSFIGNHTGCFAIHHAQVSPEPYDFFVLSEHGMREMPIGLRDVWCYMNPKVLQKGEYLTSELEGCMSFGFRNPKKVLRRTTVVAQCDTPQGRETHQLLGLAARIFQHEVDHGKGKSIYD